MGLVVKVVVVVNIVPEVVCEAVGLAGCLCSAVGVKPAEGREGGVVEKVLEKPEGVRSFSACDAGPSLGGVWVGVVVLVLVESRGAVNLETGVFVGRGLRGVVVFVEDCNLQHINKLDLHSSHVGKCDAIRLNRLWTPHSRLTFVLQALLCTVSVIQLPVH